jgi:hypothetical protein
MKKTERRIQIFIGLAMIGFGLWNGRVLLAQKILSGSELENGCQAYADKAVKLAKEWEELQCQKKLNNSPQLFDTDRTWQYNRCRNSVGTTIASDLQSMENDIKPCRAMSGRQGGQTQGWQGGQGGQGSQGGQGGQPRWPDNTNTRNPGWNTPGNNNGNLSGEIWDITVINSADMARSYHTFRIPSLNGRFTGQNLNPAGGPDFSGQMNGSVFEAVMTDNTGYRATFIGHGAGYGAIDGTGCDNRNRSFSFTMRRR